MNTNRIRTGMATRALLGTIVAIGIPIMVFIGSIVFYRQLNAQQNALAAQRRAETVQQRLIAEDRADATVSFDEIDDPTQPTIRTTESFQRQIETQYVPVRDPKSGVTVYEPRQVVRIVPTVDRYVTGVIPPTPSPALNLAMQLRGLSQEDPQRKTKLSELRTALDTEFQQRHQQQAIEIERTAKRLETLKQMHGERAEKKDLIVQRRMDELLGQPDPLRWDSVPPNPRLRETSTAGAPIGLNDPSQFNVSHPNPNAPADVPTTDEQPTTGSLNPFEETKQVTQPIEIKTSVGDDIFSAAREVATAKVELELAKTSLERISRLVKNAAVPMSELQNHEFQLKRAEQEHAFALARLESIEQKLHRDIEFSKQQLQLANQQLEIARGQSALGLSGQAEELKSQQASEMAKQALEEATARIAEFEKARSLIGPADDESMRDPAATDRNTEGSIEKKRENSPRNSADVELKLDLFDEQEPNAARPGAG